VHVPDVFVAIRAAGERTEGASGELASAQVAAGGVQVIRERPFARALQRSMEEALRAGARWSILLDADILLAGDAMQRMCREMEAAPGPFYMMNFRILDRTFGGPAYGVHCYTTSLLSRALPVLGKAMDDQRPETRLYREMGRLGHRTVRSASVVALHDYEQYYRDLYRKMFVRAVKYGGQWQFMQATCRSAYRESPEARVMLWGLMDGMLHVYGGARSASLDAETYLRGAAVTLEMLGLEERGPLTAYSPAEPGCVIDSFVPRPEYLGNASWIAPPAGIVVERDAARDAGIFSAWLRRLSALRGRPRTA
jgi:hypothetical protein